MWLERNSRLYRLVQFSREHNMGEKGGERGENRRIQGGGSITNKLVRADRIAEYKSVFITDWLV